MSRLATLKKLKDATLSPLEGKGAPTTAHKRPCRPSGLDPYPRPSDYAKPPRGRCECCGRPAKDWFREKPSPSWRYFHNGVEYAGPSPLGFCTRACAKEALGVVVKLAKSISREE